MSIFHHEENLWSGNLENYITNLPEIFVRLRRSSDLTNKATRLKIPYPTAEQCAPDKKNHQIFPKSKTFLTHLKNI